MREKDALAIAVFESPPTSQSLPMTRWSFGSDFKAAFRVNEAKKAGNEFL